MKKAVDFGFFINYDEKTIFFSNTFMKWAKVMTTGEYQLYMEVISDFPDFKQVTIK